MGVGFGWASCARFRNATRDDLLLFGARRTWRGGDGVGAASTRRCTATGLLTWGGILVATRRSGIAGTVCCIGITARGSRRASPRIDFIFESDCIFANDAEATFNRVIGST